MPVSQPVLTISTARAQVVEGDSVTLHCATRRGSPPVLYRFYHKDVPLWMKSITSEERASFNFSATANHSGNYHCTASNRLGTQQSEPVSLSITGTTWIFTNPNLSVANPFRKFPSSPQPTWSPLLSLLSVRYLPVGLGPHSVFTQTSKKVQYCSVCYNFPVAWVTAWVTVLTSLTSVEQPSFRASTHHWETYSWTFLYFLDKFI